VARTQGAFVPVWYGRDRGRCEATVRSRSPATYRRSATLRTSRRAARWNQSSRGSKVDIHCRRPAVLGCGFLARSLGRFADLANWRFVPAPIGISALPVLRDLDPDQCGFCDHALRGDREMANWQFDAAPIGIPAPARLGETAAVDAGFCDPAAQRRLRIWPIGASTQRQLEPHALLESPPRPNSQSADPLAHVHQPVRSGRGAVGLGVAVPLVQAQVGLAAVAREERQGGHLRAHVPLGLDE
jgi:hypothetical protein